jgi:hypothetical protein
VPLVYFFRESSSPIGGIHKYAIKMMILDTARQSVRNQSPLAEQWLSVLLPERPRSSRAGGRRSNGRKTAAVPSSRPKKGAAAGGRFNHATITLLLLLLLLLLKGQLRQKTTGASLLLFAEESPDTKGGPEPPHHNYSLPVLAKRSYLRRPPGQLNGHPLSRRNNFYAPWRPERHR